MLPWVEENKLEHQFAVFTQTAVGKMLLEHAPHHCTIHFPSSLPFESLHARAKVRLVTKRWRRYAFCFLQQTPGRVTQVEDEYPTLEEDIARYKRREVLWRDFVWNLWQLSHVHEMAFRSPEALPIHVTPLSFRETICSRDTIDLLHQVC